MNKMNAFENACWLAEIANLQVWTSMLACFLFPVNRAGLWMKTKFFNPNTEWAAEKNMRRIHWIKAKKVYGIRIIIYLQSN